MIERDRILRWWTGKISDPELAEAAGMNLPNLKRLFRDPVIQAGVLGGGKGSRYTRLLSAGVRNAVAACEAARCGGVPIAQTSQLLMQIPGLAERTNSVIDWVPDPANVVGFQGFELPSDLFAVPPELRSDPLPEALDRSPLVEPNPLGFWDEDTGAPVEGFLDEHLFILNGEIVSHDGPRDAHSALLWLHRGRTSSTWPKEDVLLNARAAAQQRGEMPVGRLDETGFILWSHQDPSVAAAELPGLRVEPPDEKRFAFLRENYVTRLDINCTLPVRSMKRRFYGLKVDK